MKRASPSFAYQERDGTALLKDEEVGEIVQGGVQVGIGTSAQHLASNRLARKLEPEEGCMDQKYGRTSA